LYLCPCHRVSVYYEEKQNLGISRIKIFDATFSTLKNHLLFF